jgi:hypothetical protein
MQVDPPADGVRDDGPHGPPVEGLDESGVSEGRNDGWLLVHPVHQVQIAVLASLLTEERIDTPAAPDPDADVGLPQRGEDGQYVFCCHHGKQSAAFPIPLAALTFKTVGAEVISG